MNISTKTEQACLNLILSSSLSASINAGEFFPYAGLQNAERKAPAVIVICEKGQEEFPNGGVWHVKTEFVIKHMISDSSVTSSLAFLVEELFKDDGTPAKLAAYPNYDCLGIVSSEDIANSISGDARVESFPLEIVCTHT